MTYTVTVTETFEKTIDIDADSERDAISIASDLWNENARELDALPFKAVKYTIDNSRQGA